MRDMNRPIYVHPRRPDRLSVAPRARSFTIPDSDADIELLIELN